MWKPSENSSAYTYRLQIATDENTSADGLNVEPLQDTNDREVIVVKTLNSGFKPMNIVGH